MPVSKKRKKPKKKKPAIDVKKNNVTYVCLSCFRKEAIPYDVVREFDIMDDGDRSVPPQFACVYCGEPMYPEYYKGITGIEYQAPVII